MGGPGEGGRGGRRPQGADDAEPRVRTEGSVAVARVDVRVAVAPEQSGDLLLVPPEDSFGDGEPTAPKLAADLLPPRNRRPEPREDQDTPPRAHRLPGQPATRIGGDEDPRNAPPGTAPQPVFGQPLFAQEWTAAPQGTPNWKPGAPPVDREPAHTQWIIGAVVLVLGVGAVILWLHMWD